MQAASADHAYQGIDAKRFDLAAQEMTNVERSFKFSACAGLSSIPSHTLAKRLLLLDQFLQ